MKHLYFSFLCLGLAAGLSAQDCPPETATPTNNADFTISVLGTYSTGVFDESAAEIADYHAPTQRVIFSNGNDDSVIILDVSDPTNPILVAEVAAPSGRGGINSVGFFDLALGSFGAVYAGEDVDSPGAFSGFLLDRNTTITLPAGVLPDMLNTRTDFARTGILGITANEGEPDDDYLVDPEGSITVVGELTSQTYGFEAFNDRKEELIAAGVRIFGANDPTVAQDLEPEYVAILGDTAYVICQENNAFAVFDLVSRSFVDIIPFGYKDHSCPANALDASNRDDTINFATYNILGMYQPDAVVPFEKDGAKYLLTANEGDARDYDGFSEEARVADLNLDPTAYPDAATLQDDAVLGRLNSTTATGDTDGDGDIDQIYSYGARSFSIFSVDGTLVWDSGSEFERIIADQLPDDFNSNNDENDSFDARSDDKGPEPEAIAIGTIMERDYAFIGLERVGGVMVYDITDPTAPFFVTYVNNRDFSVDAQLEDGSTNPAVGDLGVEDITFVSAEDSPNGSPMLITANEVSGTVTFFGLGGDLVSVPNIAAEAIELSAFPNPSAGPLNVQFALNRSGRVSYQLYDMNGRQVMGRDLGFRAAGNYQENVRLETLPRGAYVLRLFTEEGIASLKIIRQ